MGEDHAITLDPMAPPSPTAVSSSALGAGEKTVVSLNGNGTADGTESHAVGAPDSLKVESYNVVSEEEAEKTLKIQSESLGEEERVSNFLEENSNGLTYASTFAAARDAVLGDAFPEEPSDEPLPELEHREEAVVETQETANQEEEEEEAEVETQETAKQDEEEVAAVVVEEQDEALDAMDIEKQAEMAASSDEQQDKKPDAVDDTKQDEIPAAGDALQHEQHDAMDVIKEGEFPAGSDEQQHKKPEDAPSQVEELGGKSVKQEVAHRSHVLGSLSTLDETSARQLLNDSGWNVSQSTRQNGKTQWYYRSPPPKPVLLGSLTSAVALWKKLADDDHKRKGGGDDDLYPMVTTFLNNVKRPPSKKVKRGRYSE